MPRLNIKAIREQRCLTQRELADLVNVSVSTICKWENEQISLSVEMLLRLAAALEVSAAELLAPQCPS